MVLIGLLILFVTFGLGEPAQEEVAGKSRPVLGTRATLTIAGMHPLGINGRGFKANERIVVSTGTSRKSVTANSAGRFVVRFTGLRCAGTTIVAVGSKGSRASTRPPKVLCVEP